MTNEEKDERLEKKEEANFFCQFFDIFRNKKVILILLSSATNWFTMSLVYNGLSYNLDVLGGNPFLNFIYSSTAELAGVAS